MNRHIGLTISSFALVGMLLSCGQNGTTGSSSSAANDPSKGKDPETRPIDFKDTIDLYPTIEYNPDSVLNIYEALQNRKSFSLREEYSTEQLDLRQLSNLLLSAYGYNRITSPEGQLPLEGLMTAPSSMAAKDIILYLLFEKGAYRYEPEFRRLVRITDKDLRPIGASEHQPYAANVPLMIIIASDLDRLSPMISHIEFQSACIDAGIVSQNIAIHCAGVGLQSRPRTSMDVEGLTRELKLGERVKPIMNNLITQ